MTPKVFNERVKLAAGAMNALAIAVLVIGVFRPLFDPSVDVAFWPILRTLLAGFATEGVAFYILGYLKEDE